MATSYPISPTAEVSETDLQALERSLSMALSFAIGVRAYASQVLNEIKGISPEQTIDKAEAVPNPSNRILQANQTLNFITDQIIRINNILADIRHVVGDYSKDST